MSVTLFEYKQGRADYLTCGGVGETLIHLGHTVVCIYNIITTDLIIYIDPVSSPRLFQISEHK